jgi:hypothetical protein
MTDSSLMTIRFLPIDNRFLQIVPCESARKKALDQAVDFIHKRSDEEEKDSTPSGEINVSLCERSVLTWLDNSLRPFRFISAEPLFARDKQLKRRMEN